MTSVLSTLETWQTAGTVTKFDKFSLPVALFFFPFLFAVFIRSLMWNRTASSLAYVSLLADASPVLECSHVCIDGTAGDGQATRVHVG